LLALADAQRRAGDVAYRETVSLAVAAARALGDAERLALAALASARPGGFIASVSVVDEALIALYEEASRALGDVDSLLRARLLGQLAVELIYTPHHERREVLSREGVAIARRVGDRTGLAQVLILRVLAITNPFTLAERLELTAELVALAAELSNGDLAWYGACQRTVALLESGDIEGAERSLAEMERLAGNFRQPFYAGFAHMGRTMLGIMRGAVDAEAQVFATFQRFTAGGQPDASVVLGAQLLTLRNNQGRIAELGDIMRANVEALPHIVAFRAVLARFYSETDQLEEAQQQVDLLRPSNFAAPLDWSWPSYVGGLSEAVCDLNDLDAAATLYEQLRPVAGQAYVVGPAPTVCAGSLGLYSGMLAACLRRWDDAERHFADAVAMNERLRARPYVVRTRRAWASMLLDRNAPGDRERATDLIAAGRAEAEQLGMARELVRFERLAERMESAATG
jgi:hypothetical protein